MKNLLRKLLIPGFLAEADRKMRLNRPVLRSSRLHFVLWFTFLTVGISAIFLSFLPQENQNLYNYYIYSKSLFFVLPAGCFWLYKLWGDRLLKKYPWQIAENGWLYLLSIFVGTACFVFLPMTLVAVYNSEAISSILEHLLFAFFLANMIYLFLQIRPAQMVFTFLNCLTFFFILVFAGGDISFLAAVFLSLGAVFFFFLGKKKAAYFSDLKTVVLSSIFLILPFGLVLLGEQFLKEFFKIGSETLGGSFLIGFVVYAALLPKINKILARNQALIRTK